MNKGRRLEASEKAQGSTAGRTSQKPTMPAPPTSKSPNREPTAHCRRDKSTATTPVRRRGDTPRENAARRMSPLCRPIAH